MAAKSIDGKALARQVRQRLVARVCEIKASGKDVRLDALLVGDDAGAAIYARNQGKACRELGIDYVLHELSADATYESVAQRMSQLNTDQQVSAIMVHLPLPASMDTERVQALIAVHKDVEGVTPANIGKVVYGQRSLVPCTALAVMEMIESTGIKLCGARCVCVGASNIVGMPVAILLMRAQATVISTNKYTPKLSELTRSADVLVSAAGVPNLIRADMVKPGAVVIDVGISRIKADQGPTRTVGDVAFEDVAKVAAHVSPVPGGVGPMTVAMLLRNAVDAAHHACSSRCTAIDGRVG